MIRLAFGISVLLCTSVWAGQLPGSLALNYSVQVGSAQLGHLITELRRDGDIYTASAETRAEGVAAILLGGRVRESCQFALNDRDIRPTSYEISKKGLGSFNHSIDFDWDRRHIRYHHKQSEPVPDGYVVDNCNMLFALMADAAQGFGKRVLHVVGHKRIRQFTHLNSAPEQLDTVLGKLDVVRIELQRVNRPERRLIFWLAPVHGYLPVKMVEKRKSRTTTMVLQSVEGL